MPSQEEGGVELKVSKTFNYAAWKRAFEQAKLENNEDVRDLPHRCGIP